MFTNAIKDDIASSHHRFQQGVVSIVTVVVLIGTSALGLVMTIYLIGLARRRSYVVACSLLAAAFALISLSSALLGVHLVYDIPELTQVRALLALIAVPCLYLYFEVARTPNAMLSRRHAAHILPVVGGVVIVFSRHSWVLDLFLIAVYLIYAVALISVWRDRENQFSALGENAHQTVVWLQTVILFLMTMLVLDGWLFADLAGGRFLKDSNPLLFAILSLAALVAFSLIGALGRPSLFEHLYSLTMDADFKPGSRGNTVPSAAEEELAERALHSLRDRAILTNESLTITRLARKLGVPARHLSQAINRVHKCSFSDLLNDHRVQFCKEIMREDTERSLMDVMLDAGYVTKSNFYRQFSIRTGLTPAAYRSKLRQEAQS